MPFITLLIEACYLFTALGIVQFLRKKPTPTEGDSLLLFAMIVGIKLFAMNELGFVLASLNMPWIFVVIPPILAMATLFALRNTQTPIVDPIASTAINKKTAALALGLVGLFSAVLFLSLRLVDETDSHHHFNYIQDWLNGWAGTVPLQYTNHSPIEWIRHYVFFWEAGFIPLLTLVPSDSILWINQFEANVTFFFLVAALGRYMGLTTILSILVAAHTLLLFSFWSGNYTGVSTIKNDVIMHCGVLFALTSILRQQRTNTKSYDALSIAALILGTGWITIKFSGPVTLAALVMLSWLLLSAQPYRKLRAHNPIAVMALTFLATTAIVYIRNTWVDGNPLYPAQIKVLGIQLNGLLQLQGSSILSHWQDPLTWNYLFGLNHHYPAGFLCWVGIILAGGYIAYTLPALYADCLHTKAHQSDRAVLRYAAAANLLLFFLYISSYWSAGQPGPGNFGYIETQNSYRYALSWFALSGLVGTTVLMRLRAPALLITAALVFDGLFRLRGIVGMEWAVHMGPETFWPAMAFTALVTAAGAAFFTCYYNPKLVQYRALSFGVLFSLILILGTQQVAATRMGHMPWFDGLSRFFAELPPQTITSLSSLDGTLTPRMWQRDYPLTGAYFQHHITRQSFPELLNGVNQNGTTSRFVSLMTAHHLPLEQQEIDFVSTGLKNYTPIMSGAFSTLWIKLDQAATTTTPTTIAGQDYVSPFLQRACANRDPNAVQAFATGNTILNLTCTGAGTITGDQPSLPILDYTGQEIPGLIFTKDKTGSALKLQAQLWDAGYNSPASPEVKRESGWIIQADDAPALPVSHQNNGVTFKAIRPKSNLYFFFEPFQDKKPLKSMSTVVSAAIQLRADGCNPVLRVWDEDHLTSKMRQIRNLHSWRVEKQKTDQYFTISTEFSRNHPLNNLTFEFSEITEGCTVSVAARAYNKLWLPTSTLPVERGE